MAGFVSGLISSPCIGKNYTEIDMDKPYHFLFCTPHDTDTVASILLRSAWVARDREQEGTRKIDRIFYEN